MSTTLWHPPKRPVWIGLLGPLCVMSEDRPFPVTAARQRSLLAALAVSAGDVVRAGALAEAVWDGAPPVSWQGTLRNYVRRLRVALGADIGGRILTRPPGYLLQARPGRSGHAVLRGSVPDWAGGRPHG